MPIMIVEVKYINLIKCDDAIIDVVVSYIFHLDSFEQFKF
jgi:hypothetical protein